MYEEPRNWEVSIRRDLSVAYAYMCSDKTLLGLETVIQEGLTKEEALAMLATIGKVEKWLWSEDGFSACTAFNVKE